MKHLFFCTLLSLLMIKLYAQPNDKEIGFIKKTINLFFEGMQKKDTAMMKSTLADGLVLQTIQKNKEGKVRIITEPVQEFLTSIINLPASITSIEERIVFDQILIDAELASVWTPYQFFVNEKLSHCGTNSFQLVKVNDEWKITFIIDTRRKNCLDNKNPGS